MLKLLALSGILFFSNSTINAQCGSSGGSSSGDGCGGGSHATTQTIKQTQGKFVSSFEVYGKCMMCADRIQIAAKKVYGIKSAEWNLETKVLKVSHDEQIDINEVHSAVAKAGHDTSIIKADDESYASLSGCCKYERRT